MQCSVSLSERTSQRENDGTRRKKETKASNDFIIFIGPCYNTYVGPAACSSAEKYEIPGTFRARRINLVMHVIMTSALHRVRTVVRTCGSVSLGKTNLALKRMVVIVRLLTAPNSSLVFLYSHHSVYCLLSTRDNKLCHRNNDLVPALYALL